MLGPIVLIVLGYVAGDILVRNIRRFVVDARSGNQHAYGMLMTYVFVGIVVVDIVMLGLGYLFKCSSLWFFPTFAISFLINMLQQYKDENGSYQVPKINQEFLDKWQDDLKKNAEKNKKK